jgi:hypothetical protein
MVARLSPAPGDPPYSAGRRVAAPRGRAAVDRGQRRLFRGSLNGVETFGNVIVPEAAPEIVANR